MPGKISILKESGELLNSNVISSFSIPETEKSYIITTENAVDPHGLTVLHVSEIKDDTLLKIATDEEWDKIKTMMRAIISGNVSSYTYIPPINQASVKGKYSRDISVSASASKQMADSYAIEVKKFEEEKKAADKAKIAEEVKPVQNNVGSIFPVNDVKPTEENEVSPGIADISVNQEVVNPINVVEPPKEEKVNVPVIQEKNETRESNANLNVMQAIPQAQIVQPVANVEPQIPGISLNFNTMPSFSPNATLDEVVAGAQELFMEGVRNLVQTMTEKIYRDLHEKEAELKEREALLNQREKILNDQMMVVMNSFGGMNSMSRNDSNQATMTPIVSVMPPLVDEKQNN